MKKGDIKRAQILDAAERLFFSKGYDGTSIQDILDALALSKGGFYHYFDAKDSVLREICLRRAEQRFDRLEAELADRRRGAVDRLNLLLNQANLFETEDVRFAALLMKLCYRDGDASISAHWRRILIDRLTPLMDGVIAQGLEDGSLYSRQPMALGRMLVLLACDVNDEAGALLCRDPQNPDQVIRVMEVLNAYRDSVELLCGAPYGTVTLFDAVRTVEACRAAAAEIARLEEKRS